jgi:hypothetical protein
MVIQRTVLALLLAVSLNGFGSELQGPNGSLTLQLVVSNLTVKADQFYTYKLTCIETNITYAIRDRYAALSKMKAPDELQRLAKMNEEGGQKAETNISTSEIYSWRGGSQIVTETINLQNKQKERTGTRNGGLLIEKFSQEVADRIDETMMSGSGSVRRRSGSSDYSGIPIFATLDCVRHFINRAKSIECSNVSDGIATRFQVTLGIDGSGPVSKYHILFETNYLTPISLSSYLGNGELYSETKIAYGVGEQAGGFVCDAAKTIIYESGRIKREIYWNTSGFNTNSEAANESGPFIPERTRVEDTRLGKAVCYHMGVRMPTPEEVQSMVISSNGVMAYEAATSRIHAGDSLSSGAVTSRKFSGRIFLFLSAVTLLSITFIVWRRSVNRGENGCSQ